MALNAQQTDRRPRVARGPANSLPRILINTSGMAVVFKPPGWEVDGPHSEVGSQELLSDFVRDEFPSSSLASLSDFQYGFVHRLDVPSSGLILVGKTFQGLYSLRMQINTCAINREYLVLCHGTASAALTECNIPIDVVARKSLLRISRSCNSGRSALTWFKFVAHGHADWRQLSMGVIRIHTGRNHQIRTHLLQLRHPTVVDARYTCHSVQLQWKQSVVVSKARERAPPSADREGFVGQLAQKL